MRDFKNIFLFTLISLFFAKAAFADQIWNNDMKSLFLSNKAIIYSVNIRTFNASDKNGNGIIEEELGEERGTFLNAIDRLDELSALGVNTINLMPVTPVGTVKALGTAGSLYAVSSFDEINPQLKSPKSKLTLNDEMKQFISECHKRNIRVIVELPCCAAYDLYLTNPDLFLKDAKQNPIVVSDWTDVRLLDAGTNEKINQDVFNLYQNFVDLMVNFDVDGIVANNPSMKPYAFWNKLIHDVKVRNPEFLFLAQASPSTKPMSSDSPVFTPYNKLLDAGFDGYYGNYSNLKNFKDAGKLISCIKSDIEISQKYAKTKSVIGNFTTHDQISPILINGPQYSKMIIWLNSTLPLNSYYIDGFPTGDNYLYPLANKKASKSYTDDDYYFMHRGQLDIFNFSRRPGGKQYDILKEFLAANKLKNNTKDILSGGDFIPFKTSSSSVFAYSRNFNKTSLVVIGNLDFKNDQNVNVYIPKLLSDLPSVPIKINNVPQILKGKIQTKLDPGEVIVLYFGSFKEK